jgi:GLPGLI family protein
LERTDKRFNKTANRGEVKPMKLLKIFLFIFILAFPITTAIGQTKITVDYDFYEGYPDVNPSTNSSLLKINDSDSVFEIYNKSTKDSTSTYFTDDGTQHLVRYPKSDENSTVIKNYKKDSLLTLDLGYHPNKFFYIAEKMSLFDWEMKDGEKEILNYKCNKATTTFRGRNYTAWFAAEIPVSDGPWKFTGLPGLILEVEDDMGNVKISAYKIILNDDSIKKLTHKKNPKYPTLTWEEYAAGVKRDYDNFIKAMYSTVSGTATLELQWKIERMEFLFKNY